MTTEDDAFDRLRAADPAAGTAPDMPAIRAAVSAATGVPLSGAVTGRVPDELAARRRRRTEWMRMAAAVAAVAVVGVGGYLVADGGSTGSATAGSAAKALPAISLNGGGASRDAANGSAMTAEGSAGGGQATDSLAPGAAPASGSAMPYYGGRTVFTGQGLSTAAGSATAWAFDASSVVTADAAAHIAASLGVTGTPRAEWGAWVVGPSDGSAANVRIDGSGNLYYYDPARDPWRCQGSGGGATGGVAVPPSEPNAAVSGAPEKAPMPATTPQASPANPSVCTAGSTPTGAAAISRARDALKSVGVDTSGAQVQADASNGKSLDSSSAAYVNVTFQQVLGGRLTGVSWSVTLVGDGTQGISGPLAPLVSLGDYPVISPAAAVDRLNDPRFGTSGGAIPYGLPMAAAGSSGSGTATPGAVAIANPSQEPTTPAAPRPGAPIAWPVQHVTLVSAQLGAALTYQQDGAQLLVPAYVLTDSSGATWSVIAVADDQLNFSTK